MFSAFKLNKQGWQSAALMYCFPNFEQFCCSISDFNCCFSTCIQVSQKAGKVVSYSNLLKNLPQVVVIYIVKGFSVVNEAEIDVFSGIVLLFLWSNGCRQLDLWFLCLFKMYLVLLDLSWLFQQFQTLVKSKIPSSSHTCASSFSTHSLKGADWTLFSCQYSCGMVYLSLPGET